MMVRNVTGAPSRHPSRRLFPWRGWTCGKPRNSLRFGKSLINSVTERVDALRGARDVIHVDTLPAHHLTGCIRNPGTGISRITLRNVGRCDLPAFNDNRGFNIAMTAAPPARVCTVLEET